MTAAEDREDWELPVIASVAALAEWLELDEGQLHWLADVRGQERRATQERLRNYRYRIIPRRDGGLGRLLEIPKARLKEIQRKLLHEILDHVPTHPAAQGFRRGHSVIEHAAGHAGREMVIGLDLSDFFTTVRAARVRAIFTGLGYRPDVAARLAGLCTNATSAAVWVRLAGEVSDAERADGRRYALDRRLASPHLPQGAPSSPALANLAAIGLDRRLDGLARSFGLGYSRYADDLTFSGPRLPEPRRRTFVAYAETIVKAEGFALNLAKTRVHLAGGRQPVCGIVVNAHPNVPRDDYDRLRAILHRCIVDGPGGQNRDGVADFAGHLRGRIAWVRSVNPVRGDRLAAQFARICWD